MILGTLISKPLLALLNTAVNPRLVRRLPGIFCLGGAGFAYYNILAGILRGLGDSLSALVFLLISTALNVGLDILFVARFNMGVPGVALATVLAQGISAVLCLLKLLKMKEIFSLNWSMLKLNKYHSLTLIKLGLPSGLTHAIFSMAMIVVQSLTNSFGEMVIACHVMVMRVDGFAMMPNFSFGAAMTAFTGQNIGAKKLDRVAQGTKEGTRMAAGVATVITIILLFFGRYLMNIFTKTTELVNLSMRMMRILAAGYIAMAISQSLSGVMRGAGDTVTPMWISLVTVIGLRVPIAYGLAYLTRSELYPIGRPESIFISLLLSWSLGALITTGCL